ncbi:MAG: glycosyltransferase family 39 protein [Anaerolineae bacterium]
MTPSSAARSREAALVVAIAVAAFALRAWGFGFGLPHTYHPDEHQYVETALHILDGEPNPGRFNNPSLYKYALAALDAGWLAAGRAFGAYDSAGEFQAAAAADPTASYALARLATALIGALTVILVYVLGREAYSSRTGLVGAALLAGTYLHARDAHFAVSDIPSAALVTASLLFSLRVSHAGRGRDYALAGATAGLAAATKYSGALVLVSLVAAHFLSDRVRSLLWPRRIFDARLLAAGLVCGAAFLVAVPFAVLDWPAFQQDIALLLERGQVGFKGLQLSSDSGWVFYAKSLWWGMGPPLIVASVAGAVLALVRHRRADIVLVVFPIVLYAWMGRQLLMFARFMLPAVPTLALLAATVVVLLADSLPDRGRLRAAATAAITAVLLVVPVSDSLRFDWLLVQPDTRDVAQGWIETNVPPGAKVLVHSNGPELAGVDHPAPGATRAFDLTVMGTTGLSREPLQSYVDAGYEYIVVSSHSYDRRLLDPAEDEARQAFYAQLDRELDLVAEFAPQSSGAGPPFVFAEIYGPAIGLWQLERPGPTIKVYRVPQGL